MQRNVKSLLNKQAWLIGMTVLSLSLSALVVPVAHAQPSKEIVFGVLPIISTKKLVARFSPLVDYLSKETGVKIRLETAPDFKTFMQRTQEKRYDLLFTAPHFYYLAQRQADYRVIVRIAAPEMKAVIVTKKDSPIKTLDDLKGKKLSITDPLALATLMVRNHLVKAGINPEKDLSLVTTPNHSAALHSAKIDLSDAAGLMLPPFKRAAPEVQAAMRIIATTDGVPHMPIAVSESMPQPLVDQIKNALIALKDRKEAQTILKPMTWPGFMAVNSEVYDGLGWAVDQMR